MLREIAELARTESVDLVLVAGDLYDTRNPGAEAEAAVYEFFKSLGDANIRSVVIAGNHDAPGDSTPRRTFRAGRGSRFRGAESR